MFYILFLLSQYCFTYKLSKFYIRTIHWNSNYKSNILMVCLTWFKYWFGKGVGWTTHNLKVLYSKNRNHCNSPCSEMKKNEKMNKELNQTFFLLEIFSKIWVNLNAKQKREVKVCDATLRWRSEMSEKEVM